MKRNYETGDISPLMKQQMGVLHEICDRLPAVDFYRCSGTRKHGCRVTVLGNDVLEVWADDWKRKPTIEENNTGSVCTKYVSGADKASAIPVKNREYFVMGDQLFIQYAYHEDWSYKWSHWTKTLDQLKEIVEHIVAVYADENGIDLKVGNGSSEQERDVFKGIC